MRLHGLIFSSVMAYLWLESLDPKIGSFLDYLHCGTCLDLEDVTAEKLMQATDSAVPLYPGTEQLKAKLTGSNPGAKKILKQWSVCCVAKQNNK